MEKRIVQIATKLDKANIKKYVHVMQVRAATFVDWHLYPSVTPTTTNWLECGGQKCNYEILSGIGGNVQQTAMVNQSANEQKRLALGIHGVQAFGVLTNSSVVPTRVEVRLIFIPNFNQYTDDAVDYLTPRFTMFYKSGLGVNGLMYRGYNKNSLAMYDASSTTVKYQTLDRKVIYLPGIGIHGTLGNPAQAIVLSTPAIYKRFHLKKYFKRARPAFVREAAPAKELSNGNYFLVWWSDGAVAVQKYRILATTNLQYSIKHSMLDDTAP